MAITVTNDVEHERYEARIGGQLAGFAEYSETGELVTFIHTEVLDGFEGRGVGSTLVAGALDDVRRRHRAVLPVCPFVKGYLARHPEQYGDLAPRARTGPARD